MINQYTVSVLNDIHSDIHSFEHFFEEHKANLNDKNRESLKSTAEHRGEETGNLVQIACFRLVPSPWATVAASWCAFNYLSSIYWTILEPTQSSAGTLALGQQSVQQQLKPVESTATQLALSQSELISLFKSIVLKFGNATFYLRLSSVYPCFSLIYLAVVWQWN